ncbi:MAG TPA: hypothetical protein VHD15_12520 [Hyphomicrobiales bacterium]|nr:hypothetical protein [Hyphomicrobiales bacterium]
MTEPNERLALHDDVAAAIDAVIAAARLDGVVIASGPEAARLAQRFAGTGIAADQIYDLLIRTALAEGITIEFRPPKP